MRPQLIALDRLPETGSDFDALVLVGADFAAPASEYLNPSIVQTLTQALALDASLAYTAASLLFCGGAPGGRLIVAPTGRLDRLIDDPRRWYEAAAAGLRRARDAGATQPVLLILQSPDDPAYAKASSTAVLGALAGLWEPLEARESLDEDVIEPVRTIGVVRTNAQTDAASLACLSALEDGRRLTRDLTGTNPERMSPDRFATYCRDAFAGTSVEVERRDNLDELRADYPLLLAVSRASLAVLRHQPVVLRLVYEGPGPIEHTYLFAGKGVTYDTGGADLKVEGHMAGMSRDKGGAAAVAGLILAVAKQNVPNIRIVAELGLVRNSVGADSFVTDEIVVSHAGARVRIGNTDAEGRLVLSDLLSHLREEATHEVNPVLFTVATLTGHAGIAVGPYSIAMENGPARAAGLAPKLAGLGEQWADPFEISRLRREDFQMVAPRTKADDALSCNNAPSSRTSRGHQFPMAFIAIASGMVNHDQRSDEPLPWLHVDIGGSGCEGGDWQHGRPTAAPVTALFFYTGS